jgi:hypothetical protein
MQVFIKSRTTNDRILNNCVNSPHIHTKYFLSMTKLQTLQRPQVYKTNNKIFGYNFVASHTRDETKTEVVTCLERNAKSANQKQDLWRTHI